MKKVNYLGWDVLVPEWANYIAADDNGEIWIHEMEPFYDMDMQSYYNKGKSVPMLNMRKYPVLKVEHD